MKLTNNEFLEVVKKVLVSNHNYYVNHPEYPMPKPCMWPDELMQEIELSLSLKENDKH